MMSSVRWDSSLAMPYVPPVVYTEFKAHCVHLLISTLQQDYVKRSVAIRLFHCYAHPILCCAVIKWAMVA